MLNKRANLNGSWFCLAAIALTGIVFRAASFRNFKNPAGGFWFDGPDPYDHLRRIYLGVKSFPSIPSFDSYAAYPKGLGQIWSPLYDYFLSAVVIFFGGTDTAVQTVGFIANPAFSLVTIVAIYFVARKIFNSDVAGLAAAFTVAIFPGHIGYTHAAKLDHHVLEPLAILILVSFTFLGRKGTFSGLETVFASLMFPMTILMWRGATLFWGVLFVYLCIRGGLEYSRGEPGYLSGSIKTCLGGAASVALVCLCSTWGSSSGFSFSIISWFHVCVLLLFAILLSVLGTVTSASVLIKRIAVIGLILSASLLLPFVRSLANELLSGLNFLGGSDSWLASIGEQQNLFHWGFSGFVRTVTLLWFALPVAVVLAARSWWLSDCSDPKLLALMVWGGGMLPLLRLRYSVVLAIPVAFAVAYLFGNAWRIWPVMWQRMASCGAVLLFVAPAAQEYRSILTFANSQVVADGEYSKNGVFEWLRINTPQTSYYDNPLKSPEYGILASWGLGSKIYYLARRPAVATAFGWEAHGVYEISGFLATGDPVIAYEIARRNRVRYILMRDEDYNFEFGIASDGVKKGKLPQGTVSAPDRDGSVYQRLKYFDGSAVSSKTRSLPALGNYRLVHESSEQFDTPMVKVSHYKVFEVVPGAMVTGECRPGDPVTLTLSLRTTTGRTVPFSGRTEADTAGRFEFRVPYATGVRQGDTVPLGRYGVSCGRELRYSFDVPEESVTGGGKVALAR